MSLVGCVAPSGGSPEDTASSETLGESTTGSGDTTTGPAEPDTTGPAEPDTTGPAEPDTTGDSTTEEPAGTDTGDTSETGDEVPAECLAADPAVSAAFTLDLPGWGLDPDGFEIDVACEVTTTEVVAGSAITELACDVDGASLPATLTLAGAPEGPVTWGVGDGVRLAAGVAEEPGFFKVRSVHLRPLDDDEALLVAALDSWQDEALHTRFAPLTVGLEAACPYDETEVAKALLRFQIPEGPAVGVLSGHRGELTDQPDWRYVIDVEEATTSTTHHEGDVRVLVRRIAG